ncbi:MAG: glycoside hydrolase family 15 protein [Terriglobales bacterium]
MSSRSRLGSRIDDYSLIGDLHTAALVSVRGTIAWLCWPDFDSEACFASLLGTEKHGAWSLSPTVIDRARRRYLPGTLISETTYTQPNGAVCSVTDFMPVRDRYSCVVRIVRGLAGRSHLLTRLLPRFDYGNGCSRVETLGAGAWGFTSGPHRLTLRTNAPLISADENLSAEWTVGAGETFHFTLQYSSSYSGREPQAVSPGGALKTTARFWKRWIGQSKYRGPYRKQIERSLLTLKALTYAPSGGLVAAPTAALPEKVGGVRNWDYRFCWLRDTTFSLEALLECGFKEDAKSWLGWLNRAIQGNPNDLKIMYGITGKREHGDWVAKWLPGYKGSSPVHIGNKASSQQQLDIYGEVMDALYRARRKGIYPHEDTSGAAIEIPLLKRLEKIWFKPDQGLWEFRSGAKHFTYSKVMAWVAFDRAIRMAEEFGIKGPVARWRKLRKQIYAQVCEKGFHKGMNSFTQAYGTRHMDASLLLLPIVGFLSPDDERISGTVRAVEKHLMHRGLLLRYDTKKVIDGLPAGEGAFLACNFWLTEVYVLQGREEEARAHFEKLLAVCNNVGLLSEEYDVRRGLVGNFPQAFSHVGLINAALSLDAKTSVRLRALQKSNQ